MKDTSLKFKLFVLSGVLLTLSIITAGVALKSANSIALNYGNIADINFPNTVLVLKCIGLQKTARQNLLLSTLPSTKEQKENYLKAIEASWKEHDDIIKVYEGIPFGPGEDVVYNALKTPQDLLRSDYTTGIALLKSMIHEPSNTEHLRLFEEFLSKGIMEHAAAYEITLDKLLDYHKVASEDYEDKAKSAKSTGIYSILLLTLISLVVGVGFSLWLTTTLNATFRAISSALNESSAQVSSAATQIAGSSEELSQSATEQAASLEQTAASIEEMNSMVMKNTQNAGSTSTTSNSSRDKATEGREVVEKMISSMDAINKSNTAIMEQVNHSNERISEIVKVIEEIGNKTKVINDIVFQTKLLSFNASVEAARAGEHGKGFAVVAEEVGNLAQMSGNAAKEISNLLAGSVQKVNDIVEETKTQVGGLIADGQKTVQEGADVARQCGTVLDDIVKSISDVARMATEISSASQEQAQGINEITKAMSQLDQVTQQNAATSEEAASAAEELSAQSLSLADLVNTLVQTVEGKSATTAPSAHPTTSTTTAKKKVVSIATHKKQPYKVAAAPMKKAVGADSMPENDDSRFRDI